MMLFLFVFVVFLYFPFVTYQNFPWKLKPLNVLNEITVNTVNEEACLIYFSG